MPNGMSQSLEEIPNPEKGNITTSSTHHHHILVDDKPQAVNVGSELPRSHRYWVWENYAPLKSLPSMQGTISSINLSFKLRMEVSSKKRFYRASADGCMQWSLKNILLFQKTNKHEWQLPDLKEANIERAAERCESLQGTAWLGLFLAI